MTALMLLIALGAPVTQLVIYDNSIVLVGVVYLSAFEFRVEPGQVLEPGADWPYKFVVGEFCAGVALTDPPNTTPLGITGNVEIVKGPLRGAIKEIVVVDSRGDKIVVLVVDLRRRYPKPVPK